jgi:hypothetical protein
MTSKLALLLLIFSISFTEIIYAQTVVYKGQYGYDAIT